MWQKIRGKLDRSLKSSNLQCDSKKSGTQKITHRSCLSNFQIKIIFIPSERRDEGLSNDTNIALRF